MSASGPEGALAGTVDSGLLAWGTLAAWFVSLHPRMNKRSPILEALLLSGGLLALSACSGTGATRAASQAPPAARPPPGGASAASANKVHAERIPVAFG